MDGFSPTFFLEMGIHSTKLESNFPIVLNQGVEYKIITKNKVFTPIFAARIASEQQYQYQDVSSVQVFA